MKRILKFTLVAFVLFLFSGHSEPAKAQRSYFNPYGYEYSANRPTYRASYRKRQAKRKSSPRKYRRVARRKTAKRSSVRRSARSARKSSNRRRKKVRKARKKNFFFERNAAGEIIKAKGPIQIVVSLKKQRVRIYQGGKAIASSRVSTGRSNHRTPAGVFSIIQKNKKHFSNLYDDAPMPYMQRITWSGIALHAGNVSRPYASHGCIRLPYGFAQKLFKRTNMGAHVIVSSGPGAAPQSISHINLFQPLPVSPIAARTGMMLASYTDKSSSETVRTDFAPSQLGLEDFVTPAVSALNKFKAMQAALLENIEKVGLREKEYEEAKILLEQKKMLRQEAIISAFASNKKLKQQKRLARKLARKHRKQVRLLKKAQRRADWSRHVVEKRRDDPRFEGNWMKTALGRLQKRELQVAQEQNALDEISALHGEAVENEKLMKLENTKSHQLVRQRKGDVVSTLRFVRLVKKTLVTSKIDVKKAEKRTLAARRDIKASQARARMPLRILITPQRGGERIKEMQRLLKEAGYDPGIADGVIGRRTREAIGKFEISLDRKKTAKLTDRLIADLYERVGRTPKGNARMYVRQGFLDLFDAPVTISQFEKPLGTHVYTAMHFEKGEAKTDWTALTVKPAIDRKKKETLVDASSVREVLDRIDIPLAVRQQVSLMITPGSSMVISDEGISKETGKGTDFVVLTK